MNTDDISQNSLEYLFSIILIGSSFFLYKSNVSNKFKYLFISVVLIQALALILLPNKKSDLIGYLLFSVGLLLIYSLRKHDFQKDNKVKQNIINYYLGFDFFNQKNFTIIGLTIILIEIVVDLYSENQQYGTADNLLILSGLTWILYYRVPNRYDFMRDYSFVFLNLCSFLLFSPILAIFLFSSNSINESNLELDDFLISKLLVVPLSNIINILGIYSFSNGVYVSFELSTGSLGTVHIAQTCTGYYSSIVFIASFISYFIVDKRKWDLLSLIVIAFGILGVYLSNLLRMTLIILAGHYYGMDMLTWTHLNAGWILFLIFILLFWSIVFKLLESDYKNTLHGAIDSSGDE